MNGVYIATLKINMSMVMTKVAMLKKWFSLWNKKRMTIERRYLKRLLEKFYIVAVQLSIV